MLVVKKFVFNMFSENSYVIWDESSRQCLIIDPGCSNTEEENRLFNYIKTNKLKVDYLLNTHCHIDHIWGCGFVKDVFGTKFYVPEKDLELLNHAGEQAGAFGIELEQIPEPDAYLDEDTKLVLGNSPVTFLFTPGHTAGEYSFYFSKEAFCITGDVLFKNSIGRTDLWGGDYNTLVTSIRSKLFTLPDNVMIYPGHGDASKIGVEKKDNPFLKEPGKKNKQ